MAYILYLDQNDDDAVQKALDKMCVCGHKVSRHGSPWMGNFIPVSQCCLCDCVEFSPEDS